MPAPTGRRPPTLATPLPPPRAPAAPPRHPPGPVGEQVNGAGGAQDGKQERRAKQGEEQARREPRRHLLDGKPGQRDADGVGRDDRATPALTGVAAPQAKAATSTKNATADRGIGRLGSRTARAAASMEPGRRSGRWPPGEAAAALGAPEAP
jgi:hypothetical protein